MALRITKSLLCVALCLIFFVVQLQTETIPGFLVNECVVLATCLFVIICKYAFTQIDLFIAYNNK